MFILISNLHGLPIISLQTGESIAVAKEPIIDPANFTVMAMLCEIPAGHSQRLLLMRDARQVAHDCLIVDSEDELAEPADVIRLQPFLAHRFSPVGKSVVTDIGRKLGTSEDFTINLDDMTLQKLYVRQSVLHSWLGSSLIIDRAQIIDVNEKQIIVRDTTVTAAAMPSKPIPDIPG